MITIGHNLGALLDKMDRIAKATQENARVSAKAGADVLYQEVLDRVPVSKKEHSTKGKKQTYQPGNLKRAIYRAYIDKDSGNGVAKYRISWNKTDAFYGLFVENEYGNSRRPATPFLRPAYDAKESEAVRAANKAFLDGLRKVIK
jgi:HK97 gp10 family phage protein